MRRAVIVIAFMLQGCYEWRPATSIPEAVSVSRNDPIRVTHQDWTRQSVRSARIEHDSLLGTTALGGGLTEPAAIPLSDIRGVDVQRILPGRTVLVIGSVTVFAIAVVGVVHFFTTPFLRP